MHVVEEFKLLPVWVNPSHLVSTALVLMRGHQLKALSVVDDGALVGIVTLDRLIAAPDNDPVGKYMQARALVLSKKEPVRKAAEAFVKNNVDFAPVFDDGQPHGIVTATMLLQELGRSWDPLTNLSWSDTLREWGIEKLKSGREITILFIDLDDFGRYNKVHGHVVGDRILRRIAGALRECLDPELDVLVRYGGDEFAIGSLRNHDQALELGELLEQNASNLFLTDLSSKVTFSLGISGGKRGKERDNVHYAATIDALINLASKGALAKKKSKATNGFDQGHEHALKAPEAKTIPGPSIIGPRPRIMFVSADELSPAAPTTVGLNAEGSFPTGVHMRGSRSLAESVAIATTSALSQATPGMFMEIDDVVLRENPPEGKIVSITGRVFEGGVEMVAAATRTVDGNLFESVAEAVLDAYYSRRIDSHPGNNANVIDIYPKALREAE